MVLPWLLNRPIHDLNRTIRFDSHPARFDSHLKIVSDTNRLDSNRESHESSESTDFSDFDDSRKSGQICKNAPEFQAF